MSKEKFINILLAARLDTLEEIILRNQLATREEMNDIFMRQFNSLKALRDDKPKEEPEEDNEDECW